MTQYSSDSAAEQGLASCQSCGKLSTVSNKFCRRCRAPLHLRKPYNIQKTLALLITALMFYIPANLYPIMATEQLGMIESANIVEGVIALWEMGWQPIAMVVFIASVIVPVTKFIILFWLCYSVRFNTHIDAAERAVLYRITEFIGRWSMVDVFVVAILVALIQLGSLLNVRPGIAALTFAISVVLTMIAAMTFDPRLLWDKLESSDQQVTNKLNITKDN